MEYQDIEVTIDDGVMTLVLNRPERMNAISKATGDEILDALITYRDDRDLRALVITGAGDKAFCSGMYVTEAAEASAESGRTEGYTIFKPWTDMMQTLEKPIICAVNGACVGGGWHLVADSDIVICSDNARFLDTHVNIGLINGVEAAGFAWKMPVGVVMRMALEGRDFVVSAEDAYRWGLVTEVTPREELFARATLIARNIADKASPLAVQGTKRAIHGALRRGFLEGVPFAWETLEDIQDTEDVAEGFRAFVEKRTPRFTGR